MDARIAWLVLELGIQDTSWMKMVYRTWSVELSVELERICRIEVKMGDECGVRGLADDLLLFVELLVLEVVRKRPFHDL